MIAMSANPIPWRARLSHAVKSLSGRDCAKLTGVVAVVIAAGFIHPGLSSMILMGLGGAVVMGHEKN